MDDHGQSGFTLVEMLVSLVIFGFVMALSLDAIRFGGAVWDTVSTNTASLDEQNTTQRFLRQRLETVSIPVAPDDASERAVSWWMDGDNDEVEFVAPWYRGAVPAGLYKFRIWQERRDGTGVLLVSWTPHLAGVDEDAVRDFSGQRVLTQGIAAFDIKYFGSTDSDRPAEWSNRWSNTSAMPALLDIRITSERTGEAWTPLVVATGH